MITAICVLSPCLGILKCSGTYLRKNAFDIQEHGYKAWSQIQAQLLHRKVHPVFSHVFFSFSKVGNESGNIHV